MKIGIITDAHLFHRKAISSAKYKEILFKDFADCNIIVDCGDLTNQSTVTSFQLEELYQIFKDISKPTFLVAGNHDSLGDKSVANVLGLRSNVQVFNEPSLIEIEGKRLLFIPYTNNIKEMFKNIENILAGKPADYIFSHLNISSNFYSDINITDWKDAKKLAKYCNYWFNGHIHGIYQYHDSFFTFYNIGACSSVTYGDDHTPCYSIFDTKSNDLVATCIKNSLVHGVYKIINYESIDNLRDIVINFYKDYNIALKLCIPCNDEGLGLRQKTKEMLSNYDNVKEITFSYIEGPKKEKKQKEVEVEKVPLIEQLINGFEAQSGISLDESIRSALQ